MDWTHLYYLAVISASFVGYTAFFLAIRQLKGEAVDRAATWSTRYLISVALCTTATCLLPPLLSNFVSKPTAIQVSSLAAVLLLGRLDVIYLWRRRAIYGTTMTVAQRLSYAVALLTDLGFVACSLGAFAGHEVAAFSSLQTLEVTVMFVYFANGLELLLPYEWEVVRDRAEHAAPGS